MLTSYSIERQPPNELESSLNFNNQTEPYVFAEKTPEEASTNNESMKGGVISSANQYDGHIEDTVFTENDIIEEPIV